MSKIIFLNGAGSSGKTSIARSIQNLSHKYWLTFGIDTFIEMTPYPTPNRSSEYFSFIPGQNERGPTMRIEIQENGTKLFGSMADFAALLADQGNNLIIDEVLFDDKHLKSYINKLTNHIVYFIGVYCDLSILQERELLRKNRAIGLSNDQIDRVHNGMRKYDLTVNTTTSNMFKTAQEIIDFVESNQKPTGFINMKD